MCKVGGPESVLAEECHTGTSQLRAPALYGGHTSELTEQMIDRAIH
jgi:hypothetical protein